MIALISMVSVADATSAPSAAKADAALDAALEKIVATRVTQPLGLSQTTLPNDATMPTPYIHGFVTEPPDPPVDASEVFAAGGAWTSGGIMSTPGDASRFIRGYTAGTTTNPATQSAQFRSRPGKSEPPGPGTNSAGLAIFHFQTGCGTVYGHTGNTPGYTQFIAATRDGSRSAIVAIGEQITPKSDPKTFAKLRAIYGLAVCAALAGTERSREQTATAVLTSSLRRRPLAEKAASGGARPRPQIAFRDEARCRHPVLRRGSSSAPRGLGALDE